LKSAFADGGREFFASPFKRERVRVRVQPSTKQQFSPLTSILSPSIRGEADSLEASPLVAS
jgi:hypothetical protein